jgi:hypothetical protein
VRDLAVLFLHLLATVARLAGPADARSAKRTFSRWAMKRGVAAITMRASGDDALPAIN